MNFNPLTENTYSQFGEDGLIDLIFKRIGTTNQRACEFGAHDGVTISNARKLILEGWDCVFIEPNPTHYTKLVRNYWNYPNVRCIKSFVEPTGKNKLSNILDCYHLVQFKDLDFLSIDVDGIDYQIFETLDVKARLICIETNPLFPPEVEEVAPSRIANGFGQPLRPFVKLAKEKGYRFIAYTTNAFFLREDIQGIEEIKDINQAYFDWLKWAAEDNQRRREFLWLRSHGLFKRHHHYHNPYLTLDSLKLSALPMIEKAFLRSNKLTNAFLNRVEKLVR